MAALFMMPWDRPLGCVELVLGGQSVTGEEDDLFFLKFLAHVRFWVACSGLFFDEMSEDFDDLSFVFVCRQEGLHAC